MALVRYLSTGDFGSDFFESYLAGAKEQAEALGADRQVFDSHQDAETLVRRFARLRNKCNSLGFVRSSA